MLFLAPAVCKPPLSGILENPPNHQHSFLKTTTMRPTLFSSCLLLITAFATTGTTLKALINSPCAVQCGNVLGGTSGDDIVCDAGDFSTSAGITFQNCTTCQLQSKYQDPDTKETDLQWALCKYIYSGPARTTATPAASFIILMLLQTI